MKLQEKNCLQQDIPEVMSQPYQNLSSFFATWMGVAQVGMLKLDLGRKKHWNKKKCLGLISILLCYQNCKNPVGNVETLTQCLSVWFLHASIQTPLGLIWFPWALSYITEVEQCCTYVPVHMLLKPCQSSHMMILKVTTSYLVYYSP